MPIPPLPLFKHRDTVITPADQNQFVTQFENTMDTMSNDVIPAINDAITDINAKTITTTTARDEAEDARDIAVAAKDEALTAVATLQAGAIDDTTIAPNKAFSNQFITNNYYNKTETYNKTEIDEKININGFIEKATPIDTDNFALQEAGGLLKKLSFTNLKVTLLTYFDTLYSRTTAVFGIGQILQNVTSSRSIGATFTNTTGKPIEVCISFRTNASSNLSIFNNGEIVFTIENSGATVSNLVSFTVLNGKTYSVGGTGTISRWTELR